MPPTSPGLRPRPPWRCRSSSVSTPIHRTMSLLSNYEGLRHQIERLVRENEELKKLVRLIRENHELKSAIKTQAGAMGISGISTMFGEGTTGSASQTSDRAAVSAHDTALDELGILSSLAEILNNTHTSLSSGPLTSPLPCPLNNTVPGSVAIFPNKPLLNYITSNLNNALAGSVPVRPNGLMANPLPCSTAAPSSNPTGSGTVPVAASTSGNPVTGPTSGSGNRLQSVSPSTGPISSSLTGPSSSAVTEDNPLTGSMTGSMAVLPVSTLSGSQPGSQPGSMNVPMAVPPITSWSSTLTGSSSGPSGSLLPAPVVNNMLLIDPAARQSSSSIAGSANVPAPSASVPKVIISTDGNKITMGWEPSSDAEPFNMAFVGQPVHTSTPAGTVTIGTPIATFFGPPEALAQSKTAIPTISSVLTSVPIAGTIPTSALPVAVATSGPQPRVAATPSHQDALTPSPSTLNAPIRQDSPSTSTRGNVQPSPTSTSLATHPPLSLPQPPPSPPPRSSASSSSANNVRGSRSSEAPNKSFLEMERKMAHRKISKLNEIPRDPKQLTWERLVGEIAFQLDRRILSNIFPERVRLYGFTVSNIPEKIIQASLNTSNHKLDEELCQTLTQRYVSVMNRLQSLGYNGRVHPGLTEQLVNAYGILRERPELAASEGGSYTMDFLQRVIAETVPPSILTDALLLLSCLHQLSQDDGKPMFIW